MELKDKVAIITGSTGSLGGAIARALAQKGCKCACHYYTNEKRAGELKEEVELLGAEALTVQADLTKPEQVDHLVGKASELGTPQILINSAAVFSRHSLQDTDFEKAREFFDLNVTAAILTGKGFSQLLRDSFGNTDSVVGKIINVSGVAAVKPWAGYVAYSASKAGLVGATKAMAKELAPSICVNSISPGIVNWPKDFNDGQKNRQLSLIPAGRIAKPEEVTHAIVFLLENDYITGQLLNVDGGRCI